MITQQFPNGLVTDVSNVISETVIQLSELLGTIADLELAILIGSRATGTARLDSDWDIAIQWKRGISFVQQLADTEQLRRNLARRLGVSEQAIDLIDLPAAGLTMRAVVAEEGSPLKGGDSLAWHRFLQRTWRELEEQYWESTYAA
ncbi:MAG: nucleotidyltransferase domain-containing protein [Geobacteraceae bacterium]|nr:nucleotidyltransferase domain-containing protein [Geobacteraceae bacterium]